MCHVADTNLSIDSNIKYHVTFTALWPTFNHSKTLYVLPTEKIGAFCMNLRPNGDYFPVQCLPLVKCESTFPSNAPTFFFYFFFLWKVPKASFVCPSGVSNVYLKMRVDHWWSDIDMVKPKSEKTLSQCHFFPPEISRGSA